MFLLALFLLSCVGATHVSCVSQADYHALLYRICSHSLVCSRVYYLTHFSPNLTTAVALDAAGDDFRMFVKQIARFDLRQLLHGALPAEWLPPAINTSAVADGLCAQTTDLTNSSAFALAVLEGLHTFGLFVRQEYYCSDRNERLYLHSDGTLHCQCVAGHSCTNEATYETVLEVLLVLGLVALVLWTASNFWTQFAMTARLQAAVAKLTGAV